MSCRIRSQIWHKGTVVLLMGLGESVDKKVQKVDNQIQNIYYTFMFIVFREEEIIIQSYRCPMGILRQILFINPREDNY